MPEVTIKTYSDSYKDKIIRFSFEISQEFDIPTSFKNQSELSDIPEYYLKGNGNFWLALDEGKLVGAIALIDIGNNHEMIKMFMSIPSIAVNYQQHP